VDVRDMIVVHTALLREFRLLPTAVARVTAGDTSSAAAVDRHLDLLCNLLHHHHEGEDALLWPLLRERVPVTAQALLDVAESQHAGLEAALTCVAAARTSWRDQPGEAHRDRLVAALDQLHAQLKAHLDAEESTVLPLAASLLTDAEWAAIGAAGAAGVPRPALPLVIGMFAYEGDPAVLRNMLATAPALVRRIVPRLAPRAYAHRARIVHGTRRP
jgi:hemerythrin-like domain-containing protein